MMKARLSIYRGNSHSKIGVLVAFFTEVIFASAEGSQGQKGSNQNDSNPN